MKPSGYEPQLALSRATTVVVRPALYVQYDYVRLPRRVRL